MQIHSPHLNLKKIILILLFSPLAWCLNLFAISRGYSCDLTNPGAIQFSGNVYNVGEDLDRDALAFVARIMVTRVGGCSGPAKIQYFISDGTAVGGVDYVSSSSSLTWGTGDDRTQTFTLRILDNNILDAPYKTVNLLLNGAVGASLGTPNSATLKIYDDENSSNPGVVELVVANSFPENAPLNQLVKVERFGGSHGTLSFQVKTFDGSAKASSDYAAISATPSMVDGEIEHSLSLNLIDDSVGESPESFSIQILDPTNSILLGTMAQKMVSIVDNDYAGSSKCSLNSPDDRTSLEELMGGWGLLLLPLLIQLTWRTRRRTLAKFFLLGSLVVLGPAFITSAYAQDLADSDLDGIPDEVDNCPTVQNPYQNDFNGDGVPGVGGGDACSCGQSTGPNVRCNAGTGIASIEQEASDFRCGSGPANGSARCAYYLTDQTCASLGFTTPVQGSGGLVFTGTSWCQDSQTGPGLIRTLQGICRSQCFSAGGIPNAFCEANVECVGRIAMQDCVAPTGAAMTFYAGAGNKVGAECDLNSGNCINCPPSICPSGCNDNNPCTTDLCTGEGCVHNPGFDSDFDGVCDAIDLCPVTFACAANTDLDLDGFGDGCDVCPFDPDNNVCDPALTGAVCWTSQADVTLSNLSDTVEIDLLANTTGPVTAVISGMISETLPPPPPQFEYVPGSVKVSPGDQSIQLLVAAPIRIVSSASQYVSLPQQTGAKIYLLEIGGGQAAPLPTITTCDANECISSSAIPSLEGVVGILKPISPGGTCVDNGDCSDFNACNGEETCDPAFGCVPGTPPSCDDGNSCTDDSCNPSSGCVHTNNSAPCSDGDACTTGDVCSGGACTGGGPLSCDDGNSCTDNSCNPASGCVFTNNTASCSDGNACTTPDVCGGGACTSGSPLSCNDGSVCTIDSCDPVTGCAHANFCDDGDACTTDTCKAMTKKGVTTASCSHMCICPKVKGKCP